MAGRYDFMIVISIHTVFHCVDGRIHYYVKKKKTGTTGTVHLKTFGEITQDFKTEFKILWAS